MKVPRLLLIALLGAGLVSASYAGDLHLKLPKRSKPTPVQKLNQEGVKAIERHKYEEARKLFYKAYLLDPNDPFTLNNLGYMAELDGDIDRAQRYYALAGDMESDATIERATEKSLQGKKVAVVAGKTEDRQMELNRINIAAMALLQKDRAPEADLLLTKALPLDPANPFTLNNLGYAKEKEGELEQGLNFYTQAANTGSTEITIVAVKKEWRGKPISEIAAENAKKVRKLLHDEESVEARVARLNLRGVSALNRNDRAAARRLFEEANRLNPNDAFALNNMGYLAEEEGDRETATFYYEKARTAQRADARVGVATRMDAEGRRLNDVANGNDQQVTTSMEQEVAKKQQQGGPVVLHRRDKSVVVEPANPPKPENPEDTPRNSTPPSAEQPNPPAPDTTTPR